MNKNVTTEQEPRAEVEASALDALVSRRDPDKLCDKCRDLGNCEDEQWCCPECGSVECNEISYADDFGSMECTTCGYVGSPGEDFPTVCLGG